MRRVFTKDQLEAYVPAATLREQEIVMQLIDLMSEREKNPGVWDGAPENAQVAGVRFATDGGKGWDILGNDKYYTRTLSKTKAREIAERHFSAFENVLACEAAINEALEGKS